MAYYCKYGGECNACGMCSFDKCYICDRIFKDSDEYFKYKDKLICKACASEFDFLPIDELKYYGIIN